MKEINFHQLQSLYDQIPRLTYKQIANHFNVPVSTITNKISKLQKADQLSQRFVIGRHLAITQEKLIQLKIITNLKNAGLTWSEISNKLGVSQQAICAFV